MVGRYFLLGLVLLSGIAFSAFHGLSLLSKEHGAGTVGANESAAHDWDTFSAQVGDWRVTGQMVERSAKRMMMEIQIADAQGTSAPLDMPVQVILEMADHPMPPVQAAIQRIEEGKYRVDAPLSMSGRWVAKIVLPDNILSVQMPDR